MRKSTLIVGAAVVEQHLIHPHFNGIQCSRCHISAPRLTDPDKSVARHFPELTLFIFIVASWNYFEPGFLKSGFQI